MSDSEKTIVIEQPWGGLGDNLQFSTLPELYHKLGYKVFISTSNAHRNPEIFDLVWKLNPFISGFSGEPPNAGACKCRGDYNRKTTSYTRNIEIAHGLVNGYREYPVIYYTPKLIPELSSCILYDTTSISLQLHDSFIETEYTKVFDRYSDLTIKKIEYEHIQNRVLGHLSHETYTIRSLYDLCDAIYSCKVYVCTFSGSSVLSSAIRGDSETPLIYSVGPSPDDRVGFRYKNISYIER